MTNALARQDWSGAFKAALATIAQEAAPKAIKPDAETESANAAAKREGAVGALFGQEVQVAIRPEARTYSGALKDALDGVRVTDTAQTHSSGGRAQAEVRGEKDLGNGLVQEVSVGWAKGKDGEAKSLVVREGKVKVNKLRALGEVMSHATQGPWYHGLQVNGSAIRPIKALEEEPDRFRVLAGQWDTLRNCVPETAKVTVSAWKPKGKAWKDALAEYQVNMTELVPVKEDATGDD